MSDRAIETLLDEDRRFPPDPTFAAQANAQPDVYELEPDAFWAEQAHERVSWLEPYETLLEPPARRLAHPIVDMGTTTVPHMARILDDVDEARAAGLMVYVHCWGGIGRTGTVVGCWLMRHGLDDGDPIGRIAQLRRAVDGLTRVVAIEVLTAARALDMRAPLEPSPATAAVLALLRRSVPGPGPDRHLSPEIEHAVDLVRTGAVVAAVENTIGELR